MRRCTFAPTAVLLASAAALAAGCGSGTKTVSVSEAPPASKSGETTAATTATGLTAKAPQHAATIPYGASTPSATRTAPAPAFTQQGATGAGSGSGVSGAQAVVSSKGFTASDPAEYHPGQTLQVLVGTRSGSGDGYGQQAFFFVDGRYIGTDAKEPSATVHVVSQGDTEVVLAYPLYRSGDALAHPSGGQTTVRFQLNDGQLVPLGRIPPVSSQSGFSRQ